MSSIAQKLIIAEEFWQSPMNTKHSELISGEVKDKALPSIKHGMVSVALGSLLYSWAQSSKCGRASLRAGSVVGRNPDTVRGPDILYIRADRIPSDGTPEGFWPFAPDLAVEIISRGETADEVSEKVRDFLAAGTPLVWTIYPDEREAVAHTPDGLARTYGEDDVLEHPDVLPGFSCKIAELFV